MTYNTISTYRHCSRCHSELTDPASQECGIGPVCRKKNNSLYARTITAKLPVASAIVLGTDKELFHADIQNRYEKFKNRFLKKLQKAEPETAEGICLTSSGVDFRNEIKDIDYFLSYRNSPGVRDRLIKLVEALGYVGLASILAGRASKSKAKVWYEDGRVYLQGTSCKYGWRAMRQIRSIKTPRYRGDKTPYSASATESELFLANVRKYWPMYDVELDEIQKKADEWVENFLVAEVGDEVEATTEPVQAKPAAMCRLAQGEKDFTLSFSWDKTKNMYGFIKELKKVTYRDRKYNPKTKTWQFKNKHKETVLAALKEYGWQPEVVDA